MSAPFCFHNVDPIKHHATGSESSATANIPREPWTSRRRMIRAGPKGIPSKPLRNPQARTGPQNALCRRLTS
jgi:hypothetical protein